MGLLRGQSFFASSILVKGSELFLVERIVLLDWRGVIYSLLLRGWTLQNRLRGNFIKNGTPPIVFLAQTREVKLRLIKRLVHGLIDMQIGIFSLRVTF